MLNKNDIITAQIVDFTHEGLGVAKIDGFPIFVENALVGEQVEILVLKVLSKFGYGKVLKHQTTSPLRVEVSNLELIKTGIAPLAHLTYQAQLDFKRLQVQKQMRLFNIEVAETLPAKRVTAYRNKAQIPVREINGRLETGFFRKNSHTLIPLEDFYIQEKSIDDAIIKLRNIFRAFKIKAYAEEKHSGDLRHIIIRRSHTDEKMMLTLVARQKSLPQLNNIIDEITKQIPNISSIILNYNPNVTNVIMGNEESVIYGEKYLSDFLLKNKFLISSKSFYQVNSEQAEVLYQEAIAAAEITSRDVVLDAYCGIGTISLAIASSAQKVFGIEIVKEAINDARQNAKQNNINNVEFILGDADEVMTKLVTDGIKPNIIIVDPARKGLNEGFILSALKTKPRKIVYISCNPATQARDLELFLNDYQITKCQPVDMFPQTHHIENLIVLEQLKK